MGLLMKFAAGGPPSASGLGSRRHRMAGLQVAAGVVLLIGSIVRLRSAYRVNLGGDGHGWRARRNRPYWRFRPRPPVSDDPILWREIHTSRTGFLGKLVGLVFSLGIYAGLAYPTLFFARRAFVEVWHHGYSSGLTTSERPELNVMTRFFFTDPGDAPADLARTDFNVFLRGARSRSCLSSRSRSRASPPRRSPPNGARQTWNSLIATSLTARDILTSKLRACFWRLRGLLLTVVVLWTIGLAAGAVHPLGYLLTVLELAAWTWLLLTFGLLVAVRWQDPATAGGGTVSLLVFPLISGVLPFALPAKLSSVLWVPARRCS